jgi:hypothetical protein
MWFTGFMPGNLGNSPFGGYFVSDQAVFITRITYTVGSLGSNCSTPAQIRLLGNTGLSYYIPVAAGFFDSGPLSPPLSIPASTGQNNGGFLIVGVPATGCIPVTGQSASDVNVSLQYVMQ